LRGFADFKFADLREILSHIFFKFTARLKFYPPRQRRNSNLNFKIYLIKFTRLFAAPALYDISAREPLNFEIYLYLFVF